MSLPDNKKDALSEKVSADIVKEVKRHYKDLRKHDVSRDDATEIVRGGIRKAYWTPSTEIEKE